MKNNHEFSNQKQEAPSSVQAVERALALLEFVAANQPSISLQELVEKSNLNRTTVWRLIRTLEQCGFVERNPLTKAYELGLAANRLAAHVTTSYAALIRRARVSMEKLREETKETVLLSVPKKDGTLTIDQIDPEHSVRLVDYVNAFLPLHCTSNGKLMLSSLPMKELEIFIKQPLNAVTARTITDREKLLADIEKIRLSGVATSVGELDENENGISASIFDKQGNLVAFVSVCGPSFRFTEERMNGHADKVLAAAAEISRGLD